MNSASEENGLVYVGVALERYRNLPGKARNSYSYGDNGSINMTIEWLKLLAPKYGKGDIGMEISEYLRGRG